MPPALGPFTDQHFLRAGAVRTVEAGRVLQLLPECPSALTSLLSCVSSSPIHTASRGPPLLKTLRLLPFVQSKISSQPRHSRSSVTHLISSLHFTLRPCPVTGDPHCSVFYSRHAFVSAFTFSCAALLPSLLDWVQLLL